MANTTLITFSEQLKRAGKLWYIINPYETTFEFPHQVPDYQQQIWPSFFLLILLEEVILYFKNGKKFRLNDQTTSVAQWMLQESVRLFSRGTEYTMYIMIYERYKWWDVPWNSPWTWCVSAFGVDFCYYWLHRCNHEIHFLWAHHQVHHSSEEFNLSVGLRQSVFQHWCNFMFYLPLALFLPPSHFIAHYQFNLIYQLWIHTTLIDNLGPLEFIFNTPKHHRVHHGCNLYCLDTNYGGVLIIWDRLFGTYREEEHKEKIIYGLVVSAQSFNPLYLQLFYIRDMLKKCFTMKSINNKLAVLWKGPSWLPGSPRLGLNEHKVNVTSRVIYNPQIPPWQSVYIALHFCLTFYYHINLYSETTTFNMVFIIVSNIFTLTSIGLLFDKSKYARMVELIRLIFHLYHSEISYLYGEFIYYVYLLSICVWMYKISPYCDV